MYLSQAPTILSEALSIVHRVQTLTSHNMEESENSPDSPHLGKIKHMTVQTVCTRCSSIFLECQGRGYFSPSSAPGNKASSQPAIAQTYMELSNGYKPASNAKKLTHGSHLISVNCNRTLLVIEIPSHAFILRTILLEPALTYLRGKIMCVWLLNSLISMQFLLHRNSMTMGCGLGKLCPKRQHPRMDKSNIDGMQQV